LSWVTVASGTANAGHAVRRRQLGGVPAPFLDRSAIGWGTLYGVQQERVSPE
jgi:hypothetical protein